MSFPPPEKVSCEQFVGILARLQHLLANLPVQLHCPTNESESRYYFFLSFNLDPDILEKTGDEIATLGEQLERVFGWKARTSGDCILPILERGKAICALHPVLKKYHEKYPENNVLKKWVIDIATGAEKAFETCGVAVRKLMSFTLCTDIAKVPERQAGTKRSASAMLRVDGDMRQDTTVSKSSESVRTLHSYSYSGTPINSSFIRHQ